MHRQRRITHASGKKGDNEVINRERKGEQRTTDNSGGNQRECYPPKGLPFVRAEVAGGFF